MLTFEKFRQWQLPVTLCVTQFLDVFVVPPAHNITLMRSWGVGLGDFFVQMPKGLIQGLECRGSWWGWACSSGI